MKKIKQIIIITRFKYDLFPAIAGFSGFSRFFCLNSDLANSKNGCF